MICSRVWPFFEIPASNSPDRHNNKDNIISLRRHRIHVLDEVAVVRLVDCREVALARLRLPQRDVNRDTTLTLSLPVVKDPRVLERALAQLPRFLLELLNRPLVDATALVDQARRPCRFPVDMADDPGVVVGLLLGRLTRPKSSITLFDSERQEMKNEFFQTITKTRQGNECVCLSLS